MSARYPTIHSLRSYHGGDCTVVIASGDAELVMVGFEHKFWIGLIGRIGLIEVMNTNYRELHTNFGWDL